MSMLTATRKPEGAALFHVIYSLKDLPLWNGTMHAKGDARQFSWFGGLNNPG
jgi:hypothetical protein